jgi:hypothetical protein
MWVGQTRYTLVLISIIHYCPESPKHLFIVECGNAMTSWGMNLGERYLLLAGIG